MSIRYALFENNLTSAPNDYLARIQIARSIDLDELIRHMIDQGSTVTAADIKAVLEDAIKAAESFLLDGNRLNFGGLVQLYPRLKGVFNGATDTYDPARHKVDVGASPGWRIRKTIRARAQIEKIEAVRPSPSPIEFVDLGSGDSNGAITEKNIGAINGYRLKFDPLQVDEGVFLICLSNNNEERVDAVQKNKPSQIVFLIPALDSGKDYVLEVRARVQGGTGLRTGRLDAILTA